MGLTQQEQFQRGLVAVQQGVVSSECFYLALVQWMANRTLLLVDCLAETIQKDESAKGRLIAIFDKKMDDIPTLKLGSVESALSDSQFEKIRHLISNSGRNAMDQTTKPHNLPDDDQFTVSYQQDSQLDPNTNSSSTFDSTESTRFRIVQRFKRGGLGDVFRARDLQLNRMVALKQIQDSKAWSRVAQERFCLEAEVTGQLEHPGIVPVYSFGIDRDKKPFYAMRFIRGVELADEIRSFHQSVTEGNEPFDGIALRQLLRRFIDVCNTIEYAHSRGVLHRDLKPRNVMVGKYGETLVVDWGIAKLLHHSSEKSQDCEQNEYAAEPVRLTGSYQETMTGSFNGTPQYAAPEQLLGSIDDLSKQTDVFSLGAILYEILIGKPPAYESNGGVREIAKQIEDSKLRSPRSLNALVPNALDRICKKAMAFEMTRRYRSCQELAEDLDRWIADLQVFAYEGSEPRLEQAGRLLRKHRNWTLSILTALSLVAMISLVAAYYINDAKNRESKAKSTAIQLKNFAIDRDELHRDSVDAMLTELENSDWLHDSPVTLDLKARVLNLATADYERLSKQSSELPELDIARVQALVRIGDLAHLQNDRVTAKSQFELALQILDRQFENRQLTKYANNQADWRLAGRIERARVWTRIAQCEAIEKRFAEAIESYDLAIKIFRSLDHSSISPFVAGNLAVALSLQGELLATTNRRAKGIALLQESLPLFDRALSAGETRFAAKAFETRENLGRHLRDQGEMDASKSVFADAKSILDDWIAKAPQNPRYRDFKASLHVSIATLERTSGDIPIAYSELQSALREYQLLHDEWRYNIRYKEGLLITKVDIGLVLLDLHQPFDALKQLEEAESELQDAVSTIPEASEMLATCISGIGQALTLLDKEKDRALECFLEAMEWSNFQAVKAMEKTDFARLHQCALRESIDRLHLSKYFRVNGEPERARSELDKAISDLQTLSQNSQSYEVRVAIAEAYWLSGWFEHGAGDETKATARFERAIQLSGSVAEEVPSSRFQWMRIHYLLHCPGASLHDVESALTFALNAYKEFPENRNLAIVYADALIQTGNVDDGLKILDHLDSPDQSLLVRLLITRVIAFTKQSSWNAAKEELAKVRNWLTQNCPGDILLQDQIAHLESQISSGS